MLFILLALGKFIDGSWTVGIYLFVSIFLGLFEMYGVDRVIVNRTIDIFEKRKYRKWFEKKIEYIDKQQEEVVRRRKNNKEFMSGYNKAQAIAKNEKPKNKKTINMANCYINKYNLINKETARAENNNMLSDYVHGLASARGYYEVIVDEYRKLYEIEKAIDERRSHDWDFIKTTVLIVLAALASCNEDSKKKERNKK